MAIFEDLRFWGQGQGLDLRGQGQGLQNVSSMTPPLVRDRYVVFEVEYLLNHCVKKDEVNANLV